MRKVVLFFLMLITLLALQAGCVPELVPDHLPVATPPAAGSLENAQQPEKRADAPPPVENAQSKLGAAALMIVEEHGVDRFSIVPVSADSGKPVEGFQPVALGGEIMYGFSKDRSQMAFLSNRTEGCQKYCLRVLDLTSWQEIIQPVPVEKAPMAYITIPEFEAAASSILLILNGQADTTGELVLVDREQVQVAARIAVNANIFGVAVTPSGNLAVHGIQSSTGSAGPLLYVALLDGDDYSLLWEKVLPEVALFEGDVSNHNDPLLGKYYEPVKVFSPDGEQLFILAADKPELITVDFGSQSIRTAKVARKTSWLERLLAGGVSAAHAKMLNGIAKAGALSPDGRYIYVVGQESRGFQNERGEYQTEAISLGLEVIDTQDGTLLESVETEASYLAISEDGQTLLLQGWHIEGGQEQNWTEVMDIPSLTVTQRLEGRAFPSHLMDGSPAWLATGARDGRAATIDIYRPGESAPRVQVNRSGYFDWVMVP